MTEIKTKLRGGEEKVEGYKPKAKPK